MVGALGEWLDRLVATSHLRYYAGRALLALRGRGAGSGGRWWEAHPHRPGDPDYPYHAAERGGEEVEERWELYEAIVRTMRDRARDGGAALSIFNSVEEGHLAWERRWERVQEHQPGKMTARWHGHEMPIAYYRPRERLAAIATRLGIGFVPNRRPYTRFANDPHANVEGNQRMAEDLFEYLMTEPEMAAILAKGRKA